MPLFTGLPAKGGIIKLYDVFSARESMKIKLPFCSKPALCGVLYHGKFNLFSSLL